LEDFQIFLLPKVKKLYSVAEQSVGKALCVLNLALNAGQ